MKLSPLGLCRKNYICLPDNNTTVDADLLR
jgi:hypothetical protein